MVFSLTAQLELKGMAREVGLAGLYLIRLFTARMLCVQPLDNLEKRLTLAI